MSRRWLLLPVALAAGLVLTWLSAGCSDRPPVVDGNGIVEFYPRGLPIPWTYVEPSPAFYAREYVEDAARVFIPGLRSYAFWVDVAAWALMALLFSLVMTLLFASWRRSRLREA